jgi:hypothetical protein
MPHGERPLRLSNLAASVMRLIEAEKVTTFQIDSSQTFQGFPARLTVKKQRAAEFTMF